MKSVTQIKSLGDVRTTISTHARSTPRLKGSTFLEVYLLDKEKQRLDTELTMLFKRQKRIEGRLGEIKEAMEELVSQAQQHSPDTPTPPTKATVGAVHEPPLQDGATTPKLRRMTVEY